MAEADPLQRIKSAAQRSEGPVSVETQRRRHFDELNQDLGLDAETQRRRARASQPSRLPSLTRIIAYLMLFSILLIIAMTVRLWYDGALGRFAVAHFPQPPSKTDWMLRRDEDASKATTEPEPANVSALLPSFIDPLPVPARPPVASQSEPETQAAVTDDDEP